MHMVELRHKLKEDNSDFKSLLSTIKLLNWPITDSLSS